MKIYTRAGDSGSSKTLSGKDLSKSDQVFETLGTLDELNSSLGLLASFLNSETDALLRMIHTRQAQLLKCGTMLALAGTDNLKKEYPVITSTEVDDLETEMDAWEKVLPELTNFILPGGNTRAAYAHHSRSICRRCEREAVKLNEQLPLDPNILKYLNRLSDWLFVLARHLNNGQDIVWK